MLQKAWPKSVKLPGFRPGKVPKKMVEQRFGKQAIMVEAAEHVVSHSYAKALEQEKIDAIGQPEVNSGESRRRKRVYLCYSHSRDAGGKAGIMARCCEKGKC
jgi:FKBP-type peptidyl-prolyl cis-trans isomerase (trigger factor)